MKKIIFLALIIALIVVMCGGCSRSVCPTYDGAIRAKKQLKEEKRGGEMSACAYRESITKKEKRNANKIWNSKYCEVKPRKR